MWTMRRQLCGRVFGRYGGLLSIVHIYGEEELRLRHVVLGSFVRVEVLIERVKGHEFPQRRNLLLDDGQRIRIWGLSFDAFANLVKDLDALSTRCGATGLADNPPMQRTATASTAQ